MCRNNVRHDRIKSKKTLNDNQMSKTLLPQEFRRSRICPVIVRLKLTEILKNKNMTYSEIADLAQVSRNTISRMCQNPYQRQFDAQTLASIAWALNLEPNDLIEFVKK